MSSERGKQVLLAALLVALAVVAYRAARPASTPDGGPTRARSVEAARQVAGGETDIGLSRLDDTRSVAPVVQRNLFRFAEQRTGGNTSDAKPAAPPRMPASDAASAVPSAPPIGLALIGIVEDAGKSTRVAVLSDERGVYHGREGDIIEGRFRIEQITEDSVEMSRLDGQTRQVIRLSGATVP